MQVAQRAHLIDAIKWVASIAQIVGYGATAMDATPVNLYCFFIGIIGWFVVGLHWRDRAIMLIHVAALVAMIGAMLA